MLYRLKEVVFSSCAIAIGCLFFSSQAQADIALDDFLTSGISGSEILDAFVGDPALTGSHTSNSTIGGTRDYSFQAFGTPSEVLNATAIFREVLPGPNPPLGTGGIGQSNDVGIRSTMSYTYNAGGAGLGLDLSGEDEIQFILRVENTKAGPDGSLISFVLTDSANNSHPYVVTFPDSGVVRILDIRAPLSEFAAHGVSLSDIDTIVLTYQAVIRDDSEFISLQAVPEPGSLALLGLGGLAFLRRRR